MLESARTLVEFDQALGAYLRFNEASRHPTLLRRGGRSLRVTPRDRRAVRILTGTPCDWAGRLSVAISENPRATAGGPTA